MPSNHLILCHPLLLLLSIFPSISVFSNEPVFRIRWPKCWSFSFSISPSNEYSRLISFGIDWLDLLAVQGTLKSLLQHHSSKDTAERLNWTEFSNQGWTPTVRAPSLNHWTTREFPSLNFYYSLFSSVVPFLLFTRIQVSLKKKSFFTDFFDFVTSLRLLSYFS